MRRVWDPRQPHRIPVWRPGVAVRKDTTDGTHEILDWRPTAQAAARRLHARQASRHGAATTAATWSLVVASRRDVALHQRRTDCRAPDCPTAIPATTLGWAVRA